MAKGADEDRVRIGHMLEAIEGLRTVVSDDAPEIVRLSWMRMRAFERGFEIISEASRHVSDKAKADEPDIAWREIAGLGNVLRHDYGGLDDTILFNAYEVRIPALEAALRRMLTRLPG